MTTLTLVGTGLIGGSLALAVKSHGLVDEVIGVDFDPAALADALQLGLIDRTEGSMAAAAETDLVCISVPTQHIAGCVRDAVDAVGSSIPVFDVGSVKAPVIAALDPVPPGFVPCHPIAGSEKHGPQAARADLFEDQPVVMTPVEATDMQVVSRVEALWSGIGARVFTQKPDEHDDDLALTSHLPHLLSFVLMELYCEGGAHLADRVGGSFRDMTRVAGCDPTVWRHILADNAGPVGKHLERFQQALQTLYLRTRDDPAALERYIERIRDARGAI